MFRDTFAVELLNRGVPIDRVSLLLGHSSVKVTEKHYAPFVKERQQQLEIYARLAWDDPGVGTANSQGVPPIGSKPAPAQVN
jgi:integrase